MNCIAIDDEPRALSIIEHYVEKVPFLNLINSFRSSLDALEFVNKEKIDLIFLDINMPDLDGTEFIETLSKPPMVIFTTAYSEYAVKSYEWNTVGYLLKPIEFNKFLKAVNKAQSVYHLNNRTQTSVAEKVEKNLNTILIKSGAQTYQVRLENILYIEASGNHSLVFTTERKIISQISLTNLALELPKNAFCRIHKSFIVSIKHLDIIERTQVKINQLILPVGRNYRESFFKKLGV